jgi:23S rRNA pseudouridine1911/1915/1917 synthase
MPAPSVYHVDQHSSGGTLVQALRGWRPELSWSQTKKLLSSRQVSVNGAMCLDAGRRVKSGDVVHVFEHPKTPQPTEQDVDLLYWDADVIVVVKPALMTTLRHRDERNWSASRKNLQPTLDEVLPRVLQRAESAENSDAERGEHHRRDRSRKPGRRDGRDRRRLPKVTAVHRLDRDTSGVMIFARNAAAERSLVKQFKEHSIDRVYRAVVHGHPEPQKITTRLIRDRGDGLRGTTTSETEGEDAVTHVRPLEDLGEYSLVECRLETGRTHQIRLHLSELGHLVCGDPLYWRRHGATNIDDQSGAPRLALHAARLAFNHPRFGERMDFDAELPRDLEKFVRRLRREAGR